MTWTEVKIPKRIPTLETARLVLGPIEESDLEAYYAICSDPEVMKPWGTRRHTQHEETLGLIRYLEAEFGKGHLMRWGIREKAEPSKLIGDIGYWRFVLPRARGELGAKLAPAFWSRGYMSECMNEVMRYGFEDLGLNSIEGNIDLENPASIRMVEKLGFERDGLVREHSYCHYRQRFIDTVLFTLRASQWKSL